MTTVRFREHEDFQRAALHMGIAGLCAGLAGHIAGWVFPGLGALTGSVPMALLLGAVAFAATPPRDRASVRALAAIATAALAGALALELLGRGSGEPTAGAALYGLAFGVVAARGLEGRRRASMMAAAAVAVLTARFVVASFLAAPALAAAPVWAMAAGAGASFGLVAAVGLLPRHLELRCDRVGQAWEAIGGRGTGEIHQILERAVELWRRVDASLEQDSPVRRTIEDSVLRLFEVAGRWRSVEAEGAASSAEALVARMEEIDARIVRSEDPVARGQYEKARAALATQLQYVREIAISRERVVARMHHYLTAMERLRFAVVSHRSADASRLSAEVQPILTDLDVLAQALTELDREEPRAGAN